MGRKPDSKAAQARKGNPGKRAPAKPRKAARARKPTKSDAVAPAESVPAPPCWLRPVAQQKWRDSAPTLAKRGVLTELDLDACALYCDAFQELHDAGETLGDEGEYITIEKTGQVYAHPAVAKRNKAIDRIRKLGEQLGLTPNARRGLELPEDTADPLTDFLAEKV